MIVQKTESQEGRSGRDSVAGIAHQRDTDLRVPRHGRECPRMDRQAGALYDIDMPTPVALSLIVPEWRARSRLSRDAHAPADCGTMRLMPCKRRPE
jgi:hypothetical protein